MNKEEDVKTRVAAAGILALVLVSQHAMAKTLEEVLKEKGVITEQDLKSVTKEDKISYKLGNGFTFQSADERFKLSLGGRLQTRYTLDDYDVKPDVSKFEIKRMYIWLKGNAYSKDLTYKVQYNLAANTDSQSGSNGNLLECFLNYRPIEEFQIEAGQDEVPFTRQEINSSGALEFVDRSIATNTFKPTYDIGVNLHGKIAKGLVEYDAGIWNGTGQNTPRSTNTPAFNTRIAFSPFGEVPYSEGDFDRTSPPRVTIGGAYFRNTLKISTTAGGVTSFGEKVFGDGYKSSSGWLGSSSGLSALGTAGVSETLAIQEAEADLAFRWLGASVEAEYFLGQAEGNTTGKELRAHGFYAQAGYFIIPEHLQLAVRYNYVDPNRTASNNLVTETQGAVSYYFHRHNLKLQGDVTSRHTQTATAPTDDMEYRLQAQLIF
jgi:phosphate-selective porin OprO and OprP